MTEQDKKTELLLELAAKKTGKSRAQLSQQLKSGDLSGLGLPPDQAAMLRRAMADEELQRQILNSPQAQALIKKLSGR